MSYTANNTQTTSIRDCGGQLRACSHIHTSQHDRVVDLQEICHGGSELLRRGHDEEWIRCDCLVECTRMSQAARRVLVVDGKGYDGEVRGAEI